jgi:prepilin-type N-terminal cleavage/methylation domain-containing protein
MILQKLERRAGRRAAFTLMEVLVVAVILVIMAGTASIFIFRYIEDAKKDRAQMDCIALKKAMETAATDAIKRGREQPQSLQDGLPWIEGGQSALMDPWNKPYQFQWMDVNGKTQAVVSTTDPDGQPITSAKQ